MFSLHHRHLHAGGYVFFILIYFNRLIILFIHSVQLLAAGGCNESTLLSETLANTCFSLRVRHTHDPQGLTTLANALLLSCLEPSEAPSRVRARALSASEIQVHWEPLPSGSTGKILAYEVGTKTRKYKVKENISTRNCPTGEDEGKTAAVGKTVECFVSTSQTGGGAAAPYSPRLTSAAV